jgi:hypothetical protein
MPTISDLKVAQFTRTTLVTGITANAQTTEIFVESSANFPVPTGNEYFYVTLVDGDTAEVVKIGANDAGSNKLTTFTGTVVANGFSSASSRVELWFTAEAFQDIQDYLTSLATASYPGVDDASIEANTTLRVKADGILTSHIKADQITVDHIKDNAVQTAQIQDGAVTNAKLASNISGQKIDPATEIPEPSVPDLNFSNLTYTTGSGTPGAGSVEGQIYIEWEEYT